MVQASHAFENPLTVGSGDLSQIRIDILQRAKIRTMPPVAVQCKLRKLDDGMVSGTMLPMPYGKGYVFGVMLPAHSALCYDTTVIRLHRGSILYSQLRADAASRAAYSRTLSPMRSARKLIESVSSSILLLTEPTAL